MQRETDEAYVRRIRDSLSVPGTSRSTRLKLAFAIPVLAMVMGLAAVEQFRDRSDPLADPMQPQARAEPQARAQEQARPSREGTRPEPQQRAVFGAAPGQEARMPSAPSPIADDPLPESSRSRASRDAVEAPITRSGVPADLNAFLTRWRDTVLDRDLDAQVNLYAPEVRRFFTKRNVKRDMVRREKEQFLRKYPEFHKYDLSDVQVENLDGNEATITFRKEWDARGQGRFAGAERQRLTLVKDSGSWKIVGEEELQVYWVRRT